MLIKNRWGDLVRTDYVGAIPGRKYEIDIAFPSLRIAIEVDGWQYHGKFKRDFHRDRDKRNLLVMNDWLLLTFSAKSVFQETGDLLDMVETLVTRRLREQRGVSSS